MCCNFFFWNIAVWQFYFLSKKQLHVSSFVDRCFVIVFSSSVFRFHRLLIVVVTFRLSFHRHRHQNLKPLSFTKTLSRGNQKVVNFVKTAILLYVQKTSTFSKDSQSLKVFLLAVLCKIVRDFAMTAELHYPLIFISIIIVYSPRETVTGIIQRSQWGYFKNRLATESLELSNRVTQRETTEKKKTRK